MGDAGVLRPVRGFAAAGQWETVWQWANGTATGKTDAQFHLDTGFYLFDLPFYEALLGFVSAVLILSLLVSALVLYLYGSVRVGGQGELRISKAARVQLAVIAGVYLLVQAASLWVDRYKTLTATEDKITGAAFTGVNATIPRSVHPRDHRGARGRAVLRHRSDRPLALPARGDGAAHRRRARARHRLSLGGEHLPGEAEPEPAAGAVLRAQPQGDEGAYGIDAVDTTPFKAQTTAESGQLRSDADTTASIRIMDPNVIGPTFQQLEQYRSYYKFPQKLDVDRYKIDGKNQDALVAVREIDTSRIPQPDLEQQHARVHARLRSRRRGGQPAHRRRRAGVPRAGGHPDVRHPDRQQEVRATRVLRRELAGLLDRGRPPKGTAPVEIDYPRGKDSSENQTKTTFTGDGGPRIGNFFTKLLYALKFQSEQILFSDSVNQDSQILYDRDPADRVQKAAPYLTLDSDPPYPSIVDGRIVWIVDGYTTSSNYPYSTTVNLPKAISDSVNTQPGFVTDDINYIRNSVKATVDAYDGKVTLYAWDPSDPVLKTWQKIYPGTLKPISDMSSQLMSHVRYPTDLFKVQRAMLGTYHVNDAASFARQDNLWETPNDPQSGSANPELQPPYYLSMKMPGQDQSQFSMYTTFIPRLAGIQQPQRAVRVPGGGCGCGLDGGQEVRLVRQAAHAGDRRGHDRARSRSGAELVRLGSDGRTAAQPAEAGGAVQGHPRQPADAAGRRRVPVRAARLRAVLGRHAGAAPAEDPRRVR